jgi:hypothetical protein
MKRLPDIAMGECLRELRAACPNFERILGHPDGGRRWADHGQRMRDNARHLGAFADFFGSHTGTDSIGIEELKRAFQVIRADCTVRAEVTPVAFEYCRAVPVDTREAEEFLHAVAPIPETV